MFPRGVRVASRGAAVALMLALAACGADRRAAPGEPVTLVFKHAKHPQYEVLADLIAQFETEHPGVRVREEILPANSDDQHQFYVINLAAGADDFDVLDLDIIWVPEFARAGWLAPLTALVPDEELAPILDAPLEADRLGGELYALPWFVDAGVLYYRTDLLAKYGFDPPATFDELRRQARRILDAEANPQLYGFVWQGMQYEGLVCVALEFIRGYGGDLFIDESGPALSSDQTLDALRFMDASIRADGITPPLVTTMSEEPSRLVFQSGRAVFMRNWPYAWPLVSGPGSPVAGRVGFTLVSHVEGHESAPTLGGYHVGVNARSPHVGEAARFVRFMTRYASQKRIALGMGRLPAHEEVYRDAEVLAALPHLPGLLAAVRQARPRPVTPYYLMLSQILQTELSAVVADIRTPEEAMRLASGQIDRLLGDRDDR